MNLSYEYLIIVGILILISFIIIKINKKDFKIEINKLVQYLGGKDNIISADYHMSRLKVRVKDTSIVDKDAIQRLGAKGIVEVDDELKIILDSNSKNIKKYISDLK